MADGSFEDPPVENYLDTPAGTWWDYRGSTGIAANGGDYTSSNPDAPDGNQVAFIRNKGWITTSFISTSGKYTLEFMAAQRRNGKAEKGSGPIIFKR